VAKTSSVFHLQVCFLHSVGICISKLWPTRVMFSCLYPRLFTVHPSVFRRSSHKSCCFLSFPLPHKYVAEARLPAIYTACPKSRYSETVLTFHSGTHCCTYSQTLAGSDSEEQRKLLKLLYTAFDLYFRSPKH
jgi:hypothetical protein